MNEITIRHLKLHIAKLRLSIATDIGRLEKLPELSLSQRAEHLRRRINAHQIVIADLEKQIAGDEDIASACCVAAETFEHDKDCALRNAESDVCGICGCPGCPYCEVFDGPPPGDLLCLCKTARGAESEADR